MGLLDDAIREHLELKRLRGADPGLVAREEHEAFGPVRGGEPKDADDDDAAPGDFASADDPSVRDGPAQASPPGGAQAQPEPDDGAQDFSNVGQETAELDMRAVLGEESGHDVASVGPLTGGPIASRPLAAGDHPERGAHPAEQSAADDSLEWEMPGDGGESVGSVEQPNEPVEDVLEETPDFLRDTPEQERLWFEQRPPRDFDFDK